MDTPDPKDTPARRCTATAKTSGARCKRRPIPGGTVCVMHGGKAPQVQRAARARLAAAVDPAIGVLVSIVEGGMYDADPGHKIRAAEAILDRAGYPRRSEVDLTDSRERIVEQLKALRDSGSPADD